MTREEITKEIISLKGNNWLLELPTGFGKSKIAIDKIKALGCKKLLLVVNRIVHKQNWADEFTKWWTDNNLDITMTTYVSLHKYYGDYDVAVFDECHHLSERCRTILSNYNIKYSILLSATVKRSLKDELKLMYRNNLSVYTVNLRNAIDNNILPDPRVILISLELDTDTVMSNYIYNAKAKGKPILCSYADRRRYLFNKKYPVAVGCTERQYYACISSEIETNKRIYERTRMTALKHRWLHLCGQRLRWLSDRKVPYVQYLLSKLKNYRTLTFCNSIEQTELLGKYCINSENKDSEDILMQFNKGSIDHITACNMLNEGINLTNCQVGIYANLNSSVTIVAQRAGRLLRHPEPIIIIPYYTDTREQELVGKMLENYNKELIFKVDNIDDFVF